MTPNPYECYFCGDPGLDYLCRDCRKHHTYQEVAEKRLIAAILRHPAKGTSNV